MRYLSLSPEGRGSQICVGKEQFGIVNWIIDWWRIPVLIILTLIGMISVWMPWLVAALFTPVLCWGIMTLSVFLTNMQGSDDPMRLGHYGGFSFLVYIGCSFIYLVLILLSAGMKYLVTS